MKILWIVNTIFPYPVEKLGLEKNNFGGWLNGLANELVKNNNIELAIATVYKGKDIAEFNDGKIKYYLIPGAPAIKYNSKLEKYWKEINDKFNPDLVHIHGTEYVHGLAFKNGCPEVKIVTSIQGLISVISEVYYANISFWNIVSNITFRDIVKIDNIFLQKNKFKKRGENEIKLIKKSDAIIGRTDWDYSNCKAIDKNMNYYFLNETLRKEFYNYKWNIENIDKYSIFCSQAGYPIKGLHYLLKAIYILKKQYPEVKLYIAGPNIIDKSTFLKKIKISGYAKYINKLIKKYEIQEQVVFTGILDEKEMLNRLLKTNVFSVNSIIENESNSLSEAAIIGVPSVASYVGGISNRIEHKKDGFLYPYTEPAMLAEYISRIFNDDNLAIELGENARKTAISRHDREKNCERTIEIYKEIIEGKSEL